MAEFNDEELKKLAEEQGQQVVPEEPEMVPQPLSKLEQTLKMYQKFMPQSGGAGINIKEIQDAQANQQQQQSIADALRSFEGMGAAMGGGALTQLKPKHDFSESLGKQASQRYQNTVDLAKLKAENAAKRDQMKEKQFETMLKLSTASGKPNVFEQAKAKAQANAAVEYQSKDRPQLASQIQNIDTSLDIMDKNPKLTGPFLGAMPEGVRKMISPKLSIAEQSMQSAIQSTLRPTLGAQFTENEGKRIMNLTFDPMLPVSENKRRANLLKDVIQKKLKFNDDLNQFLSDNNGSDKDFPYEKYNMQKVGGESPQRQDAAAPAQQSDKVKVKLPDGRMGSIPRANLEEAKKRGATEVE